MTNIYYPQDARSRPSTNVTVDSSQLQSGAYASRKNIAIFGSALSGTPGKLVHLTSSAQARQEFQGGDLLDAILAAWQPSDDQNIGAGDIYAMRVDSAKAASTTVNNVIITSKAYGSLANNVNVKLETGTQAGSYKLTAVDTTTQSQEVFDNLGNLLTVTHVGSEKYAGIENKDDVLSLYLGDDEASAVKVATFNLQTSAVARIEDLANAINSVAGFSALTNPVGDKNIGSTLIDKFDKTALVDGGKELTSLEGDLVYQTSLSDLISVEVIEDQTPDVTVEPTKDGAKVSDSGNKKEPLQPFAIRSLSGGDDGTVPTSWAPFFQKIDTESVGSVYYVIALSPSRTIQQEMISFISAETRGGYPLRGFIGGDLGETFNKTLSRRAEVNNDRICLIGDDAEVRMPDGRLKIFPAYMLTAVIAGIASFLDVGEAVTGKSVRIERLLRGLTQTQLDQYHQQGVIGITKRRTMSSTNFRIVSDVTTRRSDDPMLTDSSLAEQTDFLANGLRELLDTKFRGSKTILRTAALVKITISSYFMELKTRGEIFDYKDDNIRVTLRGKIIDVYAPVIPSQEISTINVHLSYDSGTATA